MNRRTRTVAEEVPGKETYPVYEYIKDDKTAAVDDLNDSKGLLPPDSIQVISRGVREMKNRPTTEQELVDNPLTAYEVKNALVKSGYRGFTDDDIKDIVGLTRTEIHEQASVVAAKPGTDWTQAERYLYDVNDYLGRTWRPEYRLVWAPQWTSYMVGAKALCNGVTYTTCRFSAYLGCDNAYSGVWIWSVN